MAAEGGLCFSRSSERSRVAIDRERRRQDPSRVQNAIASKSEDSVQWHSPCASSDGPNSFPLIPPTRQCGGF